MLLLGAPVSTQLYQQTQQLDTRTEVKKHGSMLIREKKQEAETGVMWLLVLGKSLQNKRQQDSRCLTHKQCSSWLVLCLMFLHFNEVWLELENC